MNRAAGTSRFGLLKGALFKSFQGVIEKSLAILAERFAVTGIVMILTIQIDHHPDGFTFPINPWLAGHT